MTYEADFITARKEYVKKVEGAKPSSSFLEGFVAQDKPKTLAKALDAANGKPAEKMLEAYEKYNDGFQLYLKQIEKQITQEKVEASKLKTPLKVYASALEDIARSFWVVCGTKQDSEEEEEEQSSEAGEAINKGGTAAANKANELNLARALAHFRGRRQTHLDAIMQFEVRVGNADRTIKEKAKVAREAVGEALSNAKLGKLPQARQIADLAISAAKDAKVLNTSLQEAYETEITKKFQPDRGLGWPFYNKDSEFALPDELLGAFKKGQVQAKNIFDSAVEKGTQILNAFKGFDILVVQAQKAAEEADSAAKMQDIRPRLRLEITTTEKQVDQAVSELAEEITNATSSQGPVGSAEVAIKGAATKRPLKDWAVLKIQAVQEKVSSCEGKAKQLTILANAITQKIPVDYKHEEEFKKALIGFGTKVLKGKQAFNAFKLRAETTVSNLKQFTT